MARNETVYSVLLSGPSDVTADLDSVAEVIDDVNILLSELAVRFKPVHWSRDATAGLGHKEAQDRINKQLSDFDAIVSIFGGRLGTPTENHPSGTAEELSIALGTARESTFGDDSIILLFKEIDLNSIKSDLESALAVQRFRKSLPPQLLYKEYVSTEDLRLHILHAFAKLLAKSLSDGRALPRRQTSDREETSDISVGLIQNAAANEEPLGLLDYMAAYERGLAEMLEMYNGISAAMVKFSEKTNETTEILKREGTRLDRSLQTAAIDTLAEEMSATAELIKNSVERLDHITADTINALDNAIELQVEDFDHAAPEEYKSLSQAAEQLQSSAVGASSGIRDFMDIVTAVPRITKNFNVSRRSLLTALQDMLGHLDTLTLQADDLASRSRRLAEA